MNSSYDYKRLAILYVDDEEQAIKYFRKLFERDFKVYTALSADAAWEVMNEHGDQIGVVISDQRMPGTTGVSLLEQIKRQHPAVVRILTTAYTELDSAIESVNQGGAFRYITKPWKLEELRGDLLRAMEFAILTQDRDRLLREKVSVLQRVLIMDRVRSLIGLGASLNTRVRNPISAVQEFVARAAESEVQSFEPDELMRTDMWELARSEAMAGVQAVNAVIENVLPAEIEQGTEVDLAGLMSELSQKLNGEFAGEGLTTQVVDSSGNKTILGETRMLVRLAEILVRRISDMDGEDRRVTLAISDAQNSANHCLDLAIQSDGPAWENKQVASLFSLAIARNEHPMGVDMDILSAHIIARHHGAELEILQDAPAGPGFLVRFNGSEANSAKANSTEPEVDEAWFDMLFSRLEDRLTYPPL